MINRILIRIKVLQILYSFLLVEKQFSLESSPSAPTKEKRFAYSLYLDLLVLMIRVAEAIERRGNDRPLVDSRFISRLLVDNRIKDQLMKYNGTPFPLQSAVGKLADTLKESAIFKNYLKDRDNDQLPAEEKLWPRIFSRIIMADPLVKQLISQRENYTMKGVERMQSMMDNTFTNFLASQDNVDEVVKSLEKSLDLARELYFRLLLLPVELTELQDRKLDTNRHKLLPTDEDINPSLRFVENEAVRRLRENPAFDEYISKNKISWMQEDPVLMQRLLKAVTESDVYYDYMSAPGTDIFADAELWRNLLKYVILPNPDFTEALEEKSVYWNDDIDIISTFVSKTLRRLEDEDYQNAILDQYKDSEDEMFGPQLVEYLYKNKETYRRYIDQALGENWDPDRLAFMDIVVLEAALSEILNFPKIPLEVSVNEYIELAKSYSTGKSGQFVHGVLGNCIETLQRDGVLLKRGLDPSLCD